MHVQGLRPGVGGGGARVGGRSGGRAGKDFSTLTARWEGGELSLNLLVLARTLCSLLRDGSSLKTL